MKRLVLLVLACAIISGGVLPWAQAQGKKGRPPAQKPPAASTQVNQAAMFYQASALQRQQAALAATLAQQARKGGRPSTVVIRTSVGTGGKKGLILSTQTTARFQQRGSTSSLTVRSTVKGPGATAAAGYVPGVFPTYVPGVYSPYMPGMFAANASGKFKQTWTETIGSGKSAIKNRFTEQVSVKGGKTVIQEKWSTTAKSPMLASLPLQLQMNQLENLLPYSYQPWNMYRPWQNPYQPYQPLLVAAPGKKTTIQSSTSWAGGSEKVKTTLVNQYDKAGRFVGTQIQVKDTKKGNASVLAPLTPQAQINLLEAAANPYGYYPYNPIAYSWGAPSYYYPNWRALDRVALLEGLPVW